MANPAGYQKHSKSTMEQECHIWLVLVQHVNLTGVTLAKHCIGLTKLRVSCHYLAIETDRYHKPSPQPVEQRLCSVCNVVEDEVHLCACNVHLRRELFARVFRMSILTSHFKIQPTNLSSSCKSNHYLTNHITTFLYHSLLLAK